MIRKNLISLFLVGLLAGCQPAKINESAVFNEVFKVAPEYNQQGLAFDGQYYYVGFDMGKQEGMIIQYDDQGIETKRSGLLPIGHAADLAYHAGYLYVANGGGKNPTKVAKVNAALDQVVEQIDLSKYGQAALLAIDHKGRLILHTAGHDRADHVFTFLDEYYNLSKQFFVPHIGRPQGLDYDGKVLYFYTDDLISIISTKGQVLRQIKVQQPKGESEGIALVQGDIAIGYNRHNRILINRLDK